MYMTYSLNSDCSENVNANNQIANSKKGNHKHLIIQNSEIYVIYVAVSDMFPEAKKGIYLPENIVNVIYGKVM